MVKSTALLEIAVSICEERLFEQGLAETFDNTAVSRIYFGNEFCERLIPSVKEVDKVIEKTVAAGIYLSILTPVVTDYHIKRIRKIFAILPKASEVIVNDWGVLSLLRREFPYLKPVAGRQLNKIIKDPRLPPEIFLKITSPDIASQGYLELLKRFGVDRLDTDLPPFPQIDSYKPAGVKLSLHALYSYVTTGRICRIGSLSIDKYKKFSPAITCRKECLSYYAGMKRSHPLSKKDLETFQHGNTVFYKHSIKMNNVIKELARLGWIDRVVLTGGWNEDISPH